MKSKNNPILFILLLNSIVLAACSSSIRISSDVTPDINLNEYKTYAWVAPGDTALNTRRDDKVYAGLIQFSANEELKKKGLVIDNQNPDAVFMFDTKIDEKIESRQTPVVTAAGYGGNGYGGYGYGYVGPGYYVGPTPGIYGGEMTSITVEEGTLMYSMFDRKTGKRLWRSHGVTTLSKNTNIQRTIKKATTFMFAELPIKHKATK